MRLFYYGKIILKYKLEHLFPKQVLSNLGILRGIFKIEPVSGPLPLRIRLALEELGPVFIKLGQLLSTRQDILGPSIINELKKLQDSVEPVDYRSVESIIKKIPLAINLDPLPAAVGSVAQVYYAKLDSNENVVVKILKPGINSTIEQDFKFLKNSSKLFKIIKTLRRLKLDKIVDELHASIKKELDLTIEAQSLDRFKHNMQQFDFIKVPKVYYVDKDVLIMERMYGTPIDQKQDLLDQNIDIVKMLNQGLEAFVVQSFYYGFYHADPHPGNVWIDKDGNRIYLDFGIMGEISKQDRETLLRLAVMLFNKRYNAVKELILNAGWTTDSLDGLENRLQTVLESVDVKSAKDFSLSVTMSSLIDVLNEYEIDIPTHLVLFVKTLVAVDGFAKSLAPSNDVIKSLIPILVKHFSRFSR